MAVVFTLAAAAAAPGAVTCTRYASPTGSDTASGSIDAPLRTAQALVDSLRAGETGCLRGGVYTEWRVQFSAAGTPTQPITLRSYPGERATVAAGYVYVPHGTDFVSVSDLEIDGQEHAAPTVQVMAADTVLEQRRSRITTSPRAAWSSAA